MKRNVITRADYLKRGKPLDQLTGLIYWISLILLLSGMWILIAPSQRDTGQRGYVYITLIDFENISGCYYCWRAGNATIYLYPFPFVLQPTLRC